jgi:23S rRNA pseudouridine1911/1915/1917 synthase
MDGREQQPGPGDDRPRERFELLVPEGVERERADRVVAGQFLDFSRVEIQEVFDAGEVSLEGRPIAKSHRVSTGERLELRLPAGSPAAIEPVEAPVEVLYEDEALVVVNKEPGLVTHPGPGTRMTTLAHVLLAHTGGHLAEAGGALRPGVVHRLDKETSGAIVFARTNQAYHAMVKAFAAREVKKEYLALVCRPPELDSGVILEPIGRHPVKRERMVVDPAGKPAHTEWQVCERFGARGARLRCWIMTGRTHQIRVHLNHLGCPILGDRLYGYRHDFAYGERSPRVQLHAQKLAFAHPVTGAWLDLEAPLPEDFLRYEAMMRRLGAEEG